MDSAAESSAASGAYVASVNCDGGHNFSKPPAASIRLIAGLGVEGDAHFGRTVQHRSRVARDPAQPNLRQVHFVHAELHDYLRTLGFVVPPGAIGENITSRGIDLLGLPAGTRLAIGQDAVVQLTGLRNPCQQIENFQAGLLKAVLHRADDGSVLRLAGVMGIVVRGGEIRPGDEISATLPDGPFIPLAVV